MSAPVTVAVVSWNTREPLARCLRSLEPEAEAERAEVWVVDNASSDGSAELIGRDFPWVSLVASPDNLGFGAAVNLVAERTRSAWLAPANADVEVAPGALQALLDAGAAHPEAGALAPRLILPGGTTQHSVHPFPTLRLTLLFNLGLHRLSDRLADRLCLEGHWDPDRPRRVDWAVGAFLLVRREAFDAAGGFDPAQWLYAEDLDLGWRLARAGWATRYEPHARVHHAASAAIRQALGDEPARQAAWMAASYAWMARRRGPAAMWAIAALNVAGAALRLCLLAPAAALRPRRFRPARDRARHWLRVHRAGLARRAVPPRKPAREP